MAVGEDGSNVPGVAASWETSADGKTWTFHLRDDARWSNGEPVTAQDFVYAWRRQVDPATGSEYAEALTPIENAEAIFNGKMEPAKLGVEAPRPTHADRPAEVGHAVSPVAADQRLSFPAV